MGIFVFLCVLVNLFLLLKKFNLPITVFNKAAENTIPPVVRGLPNDLWADIEVGRRDFGEISAREIVPFKVQRPGGVIVDRSVSPGRLYVWDSGNNRILGIDLGTCYAGNPPCSVNIVIGQPSASDFGACNQDASFANYPKRKPASASTLCGVSEVTPTVLEDKTLTGMYVDTEGNLYVADMYNHRVLKYTKPFETDTVADEVWGQPDFSGNGCNIGGSMNHFFPIPPPTASSLCFFAIPSGGGGVSLDNEGNLWVADGGNNRVLRFPKNSQTGIIAKTADIVLGQPDFTTGGNYSNGNAINRMSNPTSLTFDPQGNLYVSDLANNRILVFTPPFANGMPASRTFGSSFSGIINVQNDPENRGIWTLESEATIVKLWDYDGTLKKTLPAAGGMGGASIGIDRNDNIIVATYNQEDVIIFQKNQDQSYTEKQGLFSLPPGANLTSVRKLDPAALGGVGVFENQLIVSDGRLLFWNNYLLVNNGDSPSGYIADQNFPKAADPPFSVLKVDSVGHVWVSRHIMHDISKTKIEVYQAPLTNSSTPIKVIQGEIPVVGQTEKLKNLEVFGLAPSPDSKYLWVGDPTNNRVFRIRDPLTNPAVDIILGQTKLVNNETIQDGLSESGKDPNRYNLCNRGEVPRAAVPSNREPSSDMLCLPGAISLDRFGNLFVSDHTIEATGNFRLLMFKKELFPEELANVLFAPKASKEFPDNSSTATFATFEPAFDSVNRMVVGYSPHASRFLAYFNDPTKINPNNPSDLQYALPDGQLNDFYGWPVAATFDANDNLIVFDINRGQARIYKHPFPNPPLPDLTGNPAVLEITTTPTPEPTLTPTPEPTLTPIPTSIPTPIINVCTVFGPTVLDQAQEIVWTAQNIGRSRHRVSFSPHQTGKLDGIDLCLSGSGQGVVRILDFQEKLITEQKYFSLNISGNCQWKKFDFEIEPLIEAGQPYLIQSQVTSGTVNVHRASLSTIPDWNEAWGKRIFLRPCQTGVITPASPVLSITPTITPSFENSQPVIQTGNLLTVRRLDSYWARINAYDLDVGDHLEMTVLNLPLGLSVRNCTSYQQNSIEWLGCDINGRVLTPVAKIYKVVVSVKDQMGGVTEKTLNLRVY